MKETDWAWLAGIVDGEGCIGVYHYKRLGKSKKKSYSIYIAKVIIGNTNEAIIRRCFAIAQTGHINKRTASTARSVGCYVLQASAQKALPLLNGIEPYLVGKREQCQLAIQAICLLSNKKARSAKNVHADELHRIVATMRELNARGAKQ